MTGGDDPRADLPPYTYVPGRSPHPLRDPAGHSYGRDAPACSPLAGDDWRGNAEYLHGWRLFQAGCYWEAHETWEGVWNACGRTGVAADFLKGLIKMAAAGVKAYVGSSVGVRRHALRAQELLGEVYEKNQGSRFAGVDLNQTKRLALHVAASAESIAGAAYNPPVQIFALLEEVFEL